MKDWQSELTEWWDFRVDMALEEAEKRAGRPLTDEERSDIIDSIQDYQEILSD